jgi:uncharacterized membrane protein
MVNGAAKSRPWVLILLIVSLGLNLFLGGLMAGRWFAGPHHRQSPMAAAERGPAGEPNRILQRMAASVPPEHRGAFEAAIAKHRDRIVQAASQSREAREQVRDALRQEPLDRTALDRAFENVRVRNMALQSEVQTAIADGAAAVPSDARQRLADWRAQGRPAP